MPETNLITHGFTTEQWKNINRVLRAHASDVQYLLKKTSYKSPAYASLDYSQVMCSQIACEIDELLNGISVLEK